MNQRKIREQIVGKSSKKQMKADLEAIAKEMSDLWGEWDDEGDKRANKLWDLISIVDSAIQDINDPMWLAGDDLFTVVDKLTAMGDDAEVIASSLSDLIGDGE